MPVSEPYYSQRETMKMPIAARRHHNRSECSVGSAIPEQERRKGTAPGFIAYDLCEECAGHGGS
jgi:hypothetical protein